MIEKKWKTVFKPTHIRIIVLLFGVIFFLVFYWKAELQDLSKPVSHQTDVITGKFSITVGELREINVRCQKEMNNVSLTVLIQNEDGDKIFEKIYNKIDIKNKFQMIDYYALEEPLIVTPGIYTAKFYVNGVENKDIIGRFVEYSGNYKKIFLIYSILIISFALIAIFLIDFTKIHIEYLYFIIAILMGIFWNCIAPPLAMPDEYSHFIEAYNLSNKIYGTTEMNSDKHIMVRADDYNQIIYLHNIATVSEWYSQKEEADLNEMVPVDCASTVSIKAKYVYSVPAIGISLARLFHLSGKALLILGRMFNLVVISLIMTLAIKISPYGKFFFCCVGLIPEVVLLMSSYSYDGFNIAMCMLCVAYYMYLMKCDIIDIKKLAVFILLILLLIPIKVVYCAFGLLIFLLPRGKIKIPKKSLVYIFLTGLLAGIAFIALNLSVVGTVMGMNSELDSLKETDANKLINLRYALNNINQIIYLFFRTFFENTNMYMRGAFGHLIGYTKSGAYTNCIMSAWMSDFIFILLLFGLEDTNNNLLTNGRKVIVLGIQIFCVIAVMTSMLFACTTVSSTKIEGLQGRYFLPILMLFPLLIRNNKFHYSVNKRKICVGSMVFVNLYFSFQVFHHFIHSFFI